jgi:hypothetical protein
MIDQKPKSTGELINQLTNARPAPKIWLNGKKVAVPNAAKDVTPVAQQPDLMHLPLTQRLTEARKLANKHNLSAPAAVAPVKDQSWQLALEPSEDTKAIVAMMAELEAATKDNDE